MMCGGKVPNEDVRQALAASRINAADKMGTAVAEAIQHGNDEVLQVELLVPLPQCPPPPTTVPWPHCSPDFCPKCIAKSPNHPFCKKK